MGILKGYESVEREKALGERVLEKLHMLGTNFMFKSVCPIEGLTCVCVCVCVYVCVCIGAVYSIRAVHIQEHVWVISSINYLRVNVPVKSQPLSRNRLFPIPEQLPKVWSQLLSPFVPQRITTIQLLILERGSRSTILEIQCLLSMSEAMSSTASSEKNNY
jgi:hypothetical protein